MTDRVDDEAQVDGWLNDEFVELGVRRSVARGEVLAHEGEQTDCVYLVTSGELEVVLVREVVETIVVRCPPGELRRRGGSAGGHEAIGHDTGGPTDRGRGHRPAGVRRMAGRPP